MRVAFPRTLQSVVADLVGRPLFWVLAMALLAGWPLVSGLLQRPPTVPEVLGTLPPFELTGLHGEQFNRTALQGRAWLVGFVDAGCLACAERLGGALEVLQYRLRNAGPAAGMLEVELPASTSVVDLAHDMTRRHSNPRQWHVASGPDARRLLGEIGALAPMRGQMLESGAALALVDAKGRVRAVEGIEAPQAMDRLVSKLTVVLNVP
ncbi:MAG: hypothetical protein ACLQDQ_01960 [Myxococcaceae bacterium]